MTRVQIPAYTSQWMRGDCYGEIVKTYRRLSKIGVQGSYTEWAAVKLDKSGATVRVILDDCEVV